MFRKLFNYFRPKPDIEDDWETKVWKVVSNMDWFELCDYVEGKAEDMRQLEKAFHEKPNHNNCVLLDGIRFEIYLIELEVDRRIASS